MIRAHPYTPSISKGNIYHTTNKPMQSFKSQTRRHKAARFNSPEVLRVAPGRRQPRRAQVVELRSCWAPRAQNSFRLLRRKSAGNST